jgi:hypothetical protein
MGVESSMADLHDMIIFDFRAQTDGYMAKCVCGWMGSTYWPDKADAEAEYVEHAARRSDLAGEW